MPALRRHVLLLPALASLAACVTRVGGPSVRPDWIPVENGEWVETLVDFNLALHVTRYRANDLRVVDVRRGRRIKADSRSGASSEARFIQRDSVPLRYAISGDSGWRGEVQARFARHLEYEEIRGFSFSFPIFGQRGEARRIDEAHLLRSVLYSRQEMRIGATGDSTPDEWVLVFHDSLAKPDSASPFQLTRNGRPLAVIRTTPDDAGPRGPPEPYAFLQPGAEGWMIADSNRVLAVVQERGHGVLGNNDVRAWVPSTASRAERRARLSALLLVLNAQNRMMYDR